MSLDASFFPRYGSGQTVAPGVATARITIPAGNKSVCITNLSSTVWSYVRVGGGTVVATVADYPVPPNSQVSLSKLQADTAVAFIAPEGNGSLHIMSGEGF